MQRALIHFAFLLGATLSFAAPAAADKLTVSAAYVRLAPPGSTVSAAYLVIRNSGTSDRQLVKAASPSAHSVELHEHRNENGVMKMREVRSIAVKAGDQVELKPGGYHLMLINTQKALAEGDSVAITLRFDDGSRKEVAAKVRKVHTTTPVDATMNHGAMKH